MSEDKDKNARLMLVCIMVLLVGTMIGLLAGAALFGRNGYYASAWEQLDHE